MSIDIDPLELSFRRPFTLEVSQILTIKNPNPHPVAFKVKTTAPKQYCVRPNAGRIEAGQDFDVTVLLQAMKAEPPADAKCRDKFLVQSAPITGDKEFASIASVLETTEKSSISERKIRVNWLPASSEDADGAPPAVARTPNKQTALNGGATDTPEASRTFSSPEASRELSPPSSAPPPYVDEKKEFEEDAKTESPKTAASGVVSAVASTAGSIKENAANELRQRNVSSGATTTTEKKPVPQLAQAVSPAAQGVPVKITALLCFAAFMIAYLFF